jgi:TRAP-type C4-dicarboxylate transport system substrate-binding protein
MSSIWWYSEVGWQRLPADVQAAVREGFVALASATRRAAKEREAPAIAEFLRRGGTIDVASDAQRAELRDATRGLRAWYAERYDPRWLERVDAAVAACERAPAASGPAGPATEAANVPEKSS